MNRLHSTRAVPKLKFHLIIIFYKYLQVVMLSSFHQHSFHAMATVSIMQDATVFFIMLVTSEYNVFFYG